MFRILMVAGLLWVAGIAPALSATVEGKLFAIDAAGRTITLADGAILRLTEYVVLDGLAPGQLVRVTYTDETIDATAVDVLENAPVEPVADSTDNSSGYVSDPVSDPTSDPAYDPSVETAQ